MDRHLTSSVTVSRGVTVDRKKTYAVVATIAAHIQPVSPKYENGQWGRLQKEYLLLSPDEVRVGNKLEDQDGTHYEVIGSTCQTFRGKGHYEAILRAV